MKVQFFRNRMGQTRRVGQDTGGGQNRGTGQQGGRGYGGGRGGGNKPGSGPGGYCICPKCGHKEAHVAGQRCIDQKCPECGTRMTRE